MQAAGREGPARVRQLTTMLANGKSWESVAQSTVYSAQAAALKLKPWQSPPYITAGNLAYRAGRDPNDHSCGPMPSDDEIALLNKMLALGISIYEPDPMRAIEEAEAAVKGAHGQHLSAQRRGGPREGDCCVAQTRSVNLRTSGEAKLRK
jgi:hypothetical protein